MSDTSNNAPKTRGRPFERGNSGGPGRPEGSRNRATIVLDALAEGDAEAVLRKVVDAAVGGDLRAAEILLSRVWPPRKGRSIRLDLPPVANAADVLSAISAVIESTAQGDITPDEAATVASVLELKRRALETVAIEERVAALEKAKQ